MHQLPGTSGCLQAEMEAEEAKEAAGMKAKTDEKTKGPAAAAAKASTV